MARIWIADSDPNPRFTMYSRGNTGEVFPNVITPLTGSLIADAVDQAQSEVLVESGVLRSHESQGPALSSGVFGGYLYLNVSVVRLFGVRMPGMTWREADEQIMGNAAGAPDYVPRKGDRNLLGTLATIRNAVTLLRRPDLAPLDEARGAAHTWLDTMPDLTTASDRELIKWLDGFLPLQRESMKRLVHSGMMVGAPRAIIDQLLERSEAPAGLANRLVSGTGDVDSAQLAQRLWSIGRIVADDEDLTAAFDAGLDGIAPRTRGSALDAAVAEFLADHGHRGNDEYELATPSWSMDPRPVFAAIDRLRHAPEGRDPTVAGRRLAADAVAALDEAERLVPRPLRRFLRRCVAVSRLGSAARERAKDVLVLENFGARLVLHELARRVAERGGPPDPGMAFNVTIDELEALLADPGSFAEVIAERAGQAADLNLRLPPPWFDGEIPDPSTWPLRADASSAALDPGSVLSGIGVSGGTATGRARVIADPGDPRGIEPGEVLVCAITDPSWTPLFLSAVAVVCEVGALQSHAAIVARELGIPAVMSVPGITAILDGTLLEVDGDIGTITFG